MTVRRAALVLVWCAAGAVAAQDRVGPDVRAVLTQRLRFSESDLAELSRGRVVKHDLPSPAAGEVAVVGAVRVHASKSAFFARVHDIARFKSGPGVLQIGRFSQPPALDDLAALTIDRDDFDVQSCRVGDCGIRLPADIINRLTTAIDLRAPDAQARGAAWFKQVLLDHVVGYTTDGARMTQYDDGPKPIRPQDECDGILAGMPEIGALVPGLPEHLGRFPSARLAGADDFLYWSKETFSSAAPFITVTQVTMVCPSSALCVMATKDVYSSRYLDASIALAIAADVAGAADTFDLIYENRSRANALKGFMSGMRRSLTERRARGGLEESLKTIKTQLEAVAR